MLKIIKYYYHVPHLVPKLFFKYPFALHNFLHICVYFIGRNCMKKTYSHSHHPIYTNNYKRYSIKNFLPSISIIIRMQTVEQQKLFRMIWVECHFCTEIPDFIWVNELDQNSIWAKYVINEKIFGLVYKTFVHSLFCFNFISSLRLFCYYLKLYVREYASHEHNFVSLVKISNNNRAKYYNNQWKTKFFECTRAHQKLL